MRFDTRTLRPRAVLVLLVLMLPVALGLGNVRPSQAAGSLVSVVRQPLRTSDPIAIAPCPAGTFVAAGGYSGATGLASIWASYPADLDPDRYGPGASGWVVHLTTGGSAPAPGHVYATCVPKSLASAVDVHSVSRNVAPGTTAQAVAPCPDGTKIVGGGWSYGDSAPVVLTANRPVAGTRSWLVRVVNGGASTRSFGAAARCLSSSLKVQVVTQAFSVAPGTHRDAVVSCPAGSRAAGGGFANGAPVLHATASFPRDLGGNKVDWRLRVFNPSGTARPVTGYATCVSSS